MQARELADARLAAEEEAQARAHIAEADAAMRTRRRNRAAEVRAAREAEQLAAEEAARAAAAEAARLAEEEAAEAAQSRALEEAVAAAAVQRMQAMRVLTDAKQREELARAAFQVALAREEETDWSHELELGLDVRTAAEARAAAAKALASLDLLPVSPLPWRKNPAKAAGVGSINGMPGSGGGGGGGGGGVNAPLLGRASERARAEQPRAVQDLNRRWEAIDAANSIAGEKRAKHRMFFWCLLCAVCVLFAASAIWWIWHRKPTSCAHGKQVRQPGSLKFQVASGRCTTIYGGRCLRSPNFPATYDKNEECVIVMEGQGNATVLVNDFALSQYNSGACCPMRGIDYLSIHDRPVQSYTISGGVASKWLMGTYDLILTRSCYGRPIYQRTVNTQKYFFLYNERREDAVGWTVTDEHNMQTCGGASYVMSGSDCGLSPITCDEWQESTWLPGKNLTGWKSVPLQLVAEPINSGRQESIETFSLFGSADYSWMLHQDIWSSISVTSSSVIFWHAANRTTTSSRESDYRGGFEICVDGCRCDDFFSGTDCNTADPCAGANPCSGSGSCKISDGHKLCSCEEPYSGEHCEVDPCKGCGPPGHGDCEVRGDGKSAKGFCECNDGYRGQHCEINECDSMDCGNHGTCTFATGVGSCDCATGYTGPRCETLCDATNCCPGKRNGDERVKCALHGGQACCSGSGPNSNDGPMQCYWTHNETCCGSDLDEAQVCTKAGSCCSTWGPPAMGMCCAANTTCVGGGGIDRYGTCCINGTFGCTHENERYECCPKGMCDESSGQCKR